MGSEEFASPMRGDASDPFTQTPTSAMKVDLYSDGDTFSSSSYPITVDPAFLITTFVFTENPGGKSITITLEDGSTVGPVPLGEGFLSMTDLEADAIEISDSGATGGRTSGLMVGE